MVGLSRWQARVARYRPPKYGAGEGLVRNSDKRGGVKVGEQEDEEET